MLFSADITRPSMLWLVLSIFCVASHDVPLTLGEYFFRSRVIQLAVVGSRPVTLLDCSFYDLSRSGLRAYVRCWLSGGYQQGITEVRLSDI